MGTKLGLGLRYVKNVDGHLIFSSSGIKGMDCDLIGTGITFITTPASAPHLPHLLPLCPLDNDTVDVEWISQKKKEGRGAFRRILNLIEKEATLKHFHYHFAVLRPLQEDEE